ncbi:MAG: outer membrane lipoprotein LolB [Pseudomonadota bacterium]
MIRPLLLSLLLLAGCATYPPPAVRPDPSTIATFAFQGRLTVRQGDSRHHVNIDWRHDPAGDEILLTTPLGQGVAEITRDAGGARLRLADRRHFEADDWDGLSERVFGFRLPLRDSSSWLLGEMAGGEGWRIRVTERESDAPGALPAVIELERDDIHVQLKIDEWVEAK